MNLRYFAALALLSAAAASAHPLGNNTVNRQSTIIVAPQSIQLRYLLDLAEIPTLVAAADADRSGDGVTSEEEWNAYARRWAVEVIPHLSLTLEDKPVPLVLSQQSSERIAGEAGLYTLRLEARYSASIPDAPASARLEYRDTYKTQRAGWKEIRIAAEGGAVLSEASVPQEDRSRGLTEFTLSPAAAPNELSAQASVRFPRGAAAKSDWGPESSFADTGTAPVSEPPQGHAWRHQAWSFFKLGMHHIATGWDHLVFLVGLLLISQSLIQLIKVVTAFTIAHSLTLALAANGLVTPPGELIEPAIALTIAYVGLVSLVYRESRDGAWLAFFFGLVHGFGFAGALAETLAGEPPTQGSWLVSLASFNLGIEAFQVALVCILFPLLRFASRSSWSIPAQRFASFAVVGAGFTWFFARTLGAYVT